jgi:hypothetical protein
MPKMFVAEITANIRAQAARNVQSDGLRAALHK